MADDNSSPKPTDGSGNVWDKLARLPSLDDSPLDDEWVPNSPLAPTPSADARESQAQQYHVPAPEAGATPSANSQTGAQPSSDTNFSRPDPAPISHRPERRPRRKRRWKLRLLFALVTILSVVLFGIFLVAWTTWGQVDKVAIDGLATDTGSGTNYLIVGTDSRDGVDEGLSTAGGIFGDGSDSLAGERTDTIVILRVAPDGNRILSLNRDLWVQIAGSGEQRINAAFNFGGPQLLTDTIQQTLDVPIHHYMEVDFAGFLGLVDTIGGIEVEVENPAFDPKTGLKIDQAGLVHLDAEQALAYVRTRNYVEIIDGQQVTDPTSDFGRVKRQQQFLEAVFNEVGGTRNPVTLLRAARSLSGNVRIDDTWGFWEALRFGRNLKSLDPASLELPVFDFTGPNGEAVLGLSDAAPAILDQFR